MTGFRSLASLGLVLVLGLLSACAAPSTPPMSSTQSTQSTPSTPPDPAVLKRQVEDTELSFARSMADRDRGAFVRHLSEQAVFISDGKALVGKEAVAAAWKRFFEAKQAPFSWRPDQVEVTADGLLALSTGPVFDPAGKPIARFNSVWRLEAPGTWRIVFDKGQPWDGP
jgi:ketosteroid isomerase-like protein